MEKKEYIAPECIVVEMEVVNMIATSPELGIGGDKEENSADDMSNRHRGEWGNLWK